MSFTFTQTAPNYGTLNLNSAHLMLKSLGKKLIFSNVAAIGEDGQNNISINTNVVAEGFSFRDSSTNGMVYADAGVMKAASDFQYYSNGLVQMSKLHVTNNLYVEGNVTVFNTTNILIEDPVVQIGGSNIQSDTKTGLVFTRSPFESNVMMGYLPSTDEFAIAKTNSSAFDDNSLTLDPLTDSINVHVYGTLTATQFFGDGGLLSNIQVSTPSLSAVTAVGATTNDAIEVNNSVTATIFYGDGGALSNISASTPSLSDVTAVGATTNDAIEVNNSVTATIFYGDGGALSNISSAITPSLSNVTAVGNVTTDIITAGGYTTSGTIVADTSMVSTNVLSNIVVTDSLVASVVNADIIQANKFLGDGGLLSNIVTTDTLQTVVARSNVTTGIITAAGFTTTGAISAGSLVVQSTVSTTNVLSNIVVTDTVVASVVNADVIRANQFLGDGGLLSNILTTDTLQTVAARGNVTTSTITAAGFTTAGAISAGSLVVQSTVSTTNVLSNVVITDTMVASQINTDVINANQFIGNGSMLTGVSSVDTLSNVVSRGNVTTDTITAGGFTTTGLVDADETLTRSLNVFGDAAFNGVTTVSVLRFSPSDTMTVDEGTVTASISGGNVQVNAGNHKYGSAILTGSSDNVTGFNVTNLLADAHIYVHATGINGPVGGFVGVGNVRYLENQAITAANDVVFHITKIGGRVIIDVKKLV